MTTENDFHIIRVFDTFNIDNKIINYRLKIYGPMVLILII